MDDSHDDGITYLSNVFYFRESLLKKKKTWREEESSSAVIPASSVFIDANNQTDDTTAEKRSFTYCPTPDPEKKSALSKSPSSCTYHESSNACLDCNNNDVGMTSPESVKYKRLVSQDVNFLVDEQRQQATRPPLPPLPLPPAKKKKSGRKYYRICSINGCSKRAQNSCQIDNPNWKGLCVQHGAILKKCRVSGCQNVVVNNQLCTKHGAKRRKCKFVDPSTGDRCTNQSINSGVCVKHGAKVRICSVEECTNQAKLKGMCRRHARSRPEQQQQQEQNEYQQQRNGMDVHGTYHKAHEEDEQRKRMRLTEQIQQSSRHIHELLWLGLCQNVAHTSYSEQPFYYSYNQTF